MVADWEKQSAKGMAVEAAENNIDAFEMGRVGLDNSRAGVAPRLQGLKNRNAGGNGYWSEPLFPQL